MSWRTRRCDRGQATVEAAFAIPVLFVLLLMLVQPGIVLYDRIIMRHAAAEGCRLLATRSVSSGMTDEKCIQIVKRQLSAVPPHDLFHVHSPQCTWQITVEGDESSERVTVSIENRMRLLPLFDAAGAFAGIADGQGCIYVRVAQSSTVQPAWARSGSAGANPSEWVNAR